MKFTNDGIFNFLIPVATTERKTYFVNIVYLETLATGYKVKNIFRLKGKWETNLEKLSHIPMAPLKVSEYIGTTKFGSTVDYDGDPANKNFNYGVESYSGSLTGGTLEFALDGEFNFFEDEINVEKKNYGGGLTLVGNTVYPFSSNNELNNLNSPNVKSCFVFKYGF